MPGNDPDLEWRYADLQRKYERVIAGQGAVIERQETFGSRILSFSQEMLAAWLVTLPQNVIFVTGLYICLHVYCWFTRRHFSKNFYLDFLAKWIFCLFYPIAFTFLTFLIFKDLFSLRHMRERPKPSATATLATVILNTFFS